MKVKLLSRVRLLATPWTAAHQAPLSMPPHASRNQFPFLATKNPDEKGSYCIHEGTNTEGLKQRRVQENEEETHSTDNEEEEVPGGS